mgnify:CR=1 FL=1
MNLAGKTVEELVEVALTTNCMKQIETLVEYPAMLVRRALAKNINVTAEILNRLVHDPVLNVSYIAATNPRSTIQREFGHLPVCVTCGVDERKMNCEQCSAKDDHKF